jgi:predicted PurR-regulated permease PerM
LNPIRVGITLIGILCLLGIAILVRHFLVLGFIGVLFAVLLSYPVGLLSRWMPRGLSTLIVLFVTLASAAQLSALVAPKLGEEFHSALKALPSALTRLEDSLYRIQKSSPVNQLPQGANVKEKLSEEISQWMDSIANAAIPAAKGVVEGVSIIVFVFFMAAFLVYQPELYRKGLRRLISRRYESIFDETVEQLTVGLRHWVGGIIIAMAMMGSFCALGLAISGINDWLLLGLLTFFGTFIPYLGAIASAIPGLLVALSQSPRHFIYACFVYLGVHLIEGYLVQPFIMKRAVELKPVVLLLGQSIMVTLLGPLGAIVAAPLLVCIQIAVEVLYVEHYLGKESDQPPPIIQIIK